MKRFVNLRLGLITALCLALGIVCSYFNLRQRQTNILIFGIIFGLCLLSYITWGIKTKTLIKNLYFSLVFIVAFASGAYLLDRQINNYEDAGFGGVYCEVEGTISDVWETEQGLCLSLDKVEFSGKIKGKSKYGIYAYVSGASFAELDLGERITFSTTLHDRTLFYEDVLSTKYISEKVRYTAFVDYEQVTCLGDDGNLFQKFNKFIRNSLSQGLSGDEFSLAYALLTGHDEFMDLEILTQFRSAGIAHIFAVSGLHIGFLATVLAFVFRKCRLNKWVAFALTLLVLLFYAGVCGFSSSSVRAVVMCAVGLFALNTGKKYDGLTSVGLASIIVLAISPVELFAVGFQLSFGVVLGLMFLSDPLSRLLKFMPKRLANALSAVIASQVVGIPICLSTFGKFSLVAIPFNLIFIPLTGIIYVTTFACALFGGVFSICKVALFLPNYILKGVVWAINLFDLSLFMVGGISYGVWVYLFFSAIIILCGTFNFKRIISISLATVLIVCSVGCILFDGMNLSKQVDVHISGSKNLSAYMVIYDGETTLIVNHFTRYSSVSRIERIMQKYGTQTIDSLVIAQSYGMSDVHNCLTKISRVAKVKKVYYSGEERIDQEVAIKKSFGDVIIENFLDGESLPVNFKCAFVLNGRAVDSTIIDKRILSFSKFGQNPAFKEFRVTADYVIATDYQERIFSYYRAEQNYSFSSNSLYKNAEDNGNIKINLGRI